MSTRSLIGKYDSTGVKYVYCHFDGYPEGVGAALVKNFNSEGKVDKLIKGYIRSIDEDGFVDYFENTNVDKEDEVHVVGLNEYKDPEGSGHGEEYRYLFAKGEWYAQEQYTKKGFKKVKDINGTPYDKFDSEGFDRLLKSYVTLITQTQISKSNKNTRLEDKEYVGKLRGKVNTVIQEFIKNKRILLPITRNNELVNKGQSQLAIFINSNGNYLKIMFHSTNYSEGFYYTEVLMGRKMYRVRLDDNLIIEDKAVKRKPNNINKLVKTIYGSGSGK